MIKSFKAEQQLAKDRRVREQRAYRDYLFTQMNERKARDHHKQWQDKVYIENRYMCFLISTPHSYIITSQSKNFINFIMKMIGSLFILIRNVTWCIKAYQMNFAECWPWMTDKILCRNMSHLLMFIKFKRTLQMFPKPQNWHKWEVTLDGKDKLYICWVFL